MAAIRCDGCRKPRRATTSFDGGFTDVRSGKHEPIVGAPLRRPPLHETQCPTRRAAKRRPYWMGNDLFRRGSAAPPSPEGNFEKPCICGLWQFRKPCFTGFSEVRYAAKQRFSRSPEGEGIVSRRPYKPRFPSFATHSSFGEAAMENHVLYLAIFAAGHYNGSGAFTVQSCHRRGNGLSVAFEEWRVELKLLIGGESHG